MARRAAGALALIGASLMVAGCASAGPANPVRVTSAPPSSTAVSATAVGTAAPSSSPGQLWLRSLQMTSASAGWALYYPRNPASAASGSLTLLARTTDGARTWTEVTPAAARPMLSAADVSAALDPVNSQRAYLAVTAATQDSITAPSPTAVFVTTDGGATWTESAPLTVAGAVVQLTFADAEHGWLLLDVGTGPSGEPLPWLYRTTDGGHHWSVAATAAPPGNGGPNDMCQGLAISFPTATTGWLTFGCRSGNYVVVSHDGGSTWATQPLPLPAGTCEVAVEPCEISGPRAAGGAAFLTVAPQAVSLAPLLLGSQNLGQTWHSRTLPAGAGQYPQVSFFSSTQGVLVPAAAQDVLGAVFYTTDDGGQAWTAVRQGRRFTALGSAVDFTSPQAGVAWVAGADAQAATPPPVYATANSGRTWTSFAADLVG
jgi:photosystem II stability/assembly factor-like uncharacterized protein